MPVMTFLKRPKPYSGFASAVNSLKPVETTTAADLDLQLGLPRVQVDAIRGTRGDALLAFAADRAVQAARGAVMGLRLAHGWLDLVEVDGCSAGQGEGRLRQAERVALLLRDDPLLVDDRQAVVEAGHRTAGQPAVDHVRRTATLADGAGDVRGTA